jgi:hypothetical protein
MCSPSLTETSLGGAYLQSLQRSSIWSTIFGIQLLFILVTCRSKFGLFTDVDVHLWEVWFSRWRIVNLLGHRCVWHSVHICNLTAVSVRLLGSAALRCASTCCARDPRPSPVLRCHTEGRQPQKLKTSQRRQGDRGSWECGVNECVRYSASGCCSALRDVVRCGVYFVRKAAGHVCCWHACGNTVLWACRQCVVTCRKNNRRKQCIALPSVSLCPSCNLTCAVLFFFSDMYSTTMLAFIEIKSCFRNCLDILGDLKMW